MGKMKTIKIPIGVLFEKLGIQPTEEETVHEVPVDIKVQTPEGFAPVQKFVTKVSDIYEITLEEGETLKVADTHIFIENGKETFALEAKSVDNINGKSKKIINKKFLRRDYVYDFSLPYPHLYTTPDGSIHHNTTVAQIIFLYDLARLLCLEEPQLHFKLPKSAKIFGTLTNSTLENAEQINYDPIISLIRESPFFRSKFNNTKTKSSLFHNNIDINVVSRKRSLVGKNVFTASSDEINQEVTKGGSKSIVTEMYNRINSRFLLPGNKWPAHYTMISSADTESSLIQTIIENAKDKDEVEKSDILVISAARFEVLRHKMKYSGKKFKIFIGDYQSDPFIIEKEQDLSRAKSLDPTRIYEVPIEHRGEFDDIYAGIRDVLGVAVSDVRTFIPYKEKIKEALVLHGSCQKDEIILDEDARLLDYFDKDKIDAFKPGSQKVIGLDIAYSGDRYGLAMVHIHDKITNGSLEEYEYWVDFAVGIRPPKGKKLKLYQIREFIMDLFHMGINIEYVVADSFQSTETLQLLEKYGIKTIQNSVDRKKDAYYALRDSIIEGRLKAPDNKILYKELVYLKENEKKIDHPEYNPDGTIGSKDISDAITNALWVLKTQVDYKPYLDKKFIQELEEVVEDPDVPFANVFGANAVNGEFLDDMY